jgi:hypothetical protein
MDKVFFEELELPEPKYKLSVHLKPALGHGEHTGRMRAAVETILLRERPSVVLVQGDTNSVLAGSLVAATVPWLTVGLWRGSVDVLGVDLILLGIAVGLVVWASGAVDLGWWLVRECAQVPGMPRSRPSVGTL